MEGAGAGAEWRVGEGCEGGQGRGENESPTQDAAQVHDGVLGAREGGSFVDGPNAGLQFL
jgi:hypothetical protein